VGYVSPRDHWGCAGDRGVGAVENAENADFRWPEVSAVRARRNVEARRPLDAEPSTANRITGAPRAP